jgi:hypothetical protein
VPATAAAGGPRRGAPGPDAGEGIGARRYRAAYGEDGGSGSTGAAVAMLGG